MKKVIVIAILGGIISVSFTSCQKSRGNNTGVEYAPDMADSKGYEPYNQIDSNTINPYGMNMREPVKGTVAIGQADYHFPYDNTGEGYEASAAFIMPAINGSNEEGKRLYNIYCGLCHGETGGNDGSIFTKQSGIKPAWANYQSEYIRNLAAGKIYWTITYGKNNMGSHASVLTPKERWMVVKYVKELSMIGASDTAIITATPIQ